MQDSDAIKNVIPLRDYSRKANFGFAAGRLALSGTLFDECTDRKEFSAVEISCEYFKSLPESRQQYLRKHFRRLHCGSLLTPSLATLVPGAGKHIRKEFVRTCEQVFRNLQTLEIECGALDFSLTAVLKDPDRKQQLSSLLRELHPALQAAGRTLLLPVRLPFDKADMPERVMGFLRDLMIPGLKLRLELYPHDMKPDFNPQELAKTLRLETRSVMFCFNADGGNRLMKVHIEPWLSYFALTGYTGPYLVCPFSLNNRLAAVESENYAALIQDLF